MFELLQYYNELARKFLLEKRWKSAQYLLSRNFIPQLTDAQTELFYKSTEDTHSLEFQRILLLCDILGSDEKFKNHMLFDHSELVRKCWEIIDLKLLDSIDAYG